MEADYGSAKLKESMLFSSEVGNEGDKLLKKEVRKWGLYA